MKEVMVKSVRRAACISPRAIRLKARQWRESTDVATQLLGLAFNAAPATTVCHVSLTVTSVAAQLLWTLLIGVVVSLVPAAVHDGMSGSGGHRILIAVGIFAASYLVQTVVFAANDTLRDSLVLRVQGLVRDRVAQAMLRHPTLEMVESDTVHDWVAVAVGGADGATIGQNAANVVATAGRYAVILAYCCVLATYSPLLALSVGIVIVSARVSAMAIGFRYGRGLAPILPEFRRSDYLAELALTRPAAKEARIFGLERWLVDSYMQQRREPLRRLHAVIGRVYAPAVVRGTGLGLAILAAYLWLVSGALAGRMTVGSLVVYLTALSGIFAGVNGVDTPRVQAARAALRALRELERRAATGGHRSEESAGVTATSDGLRFTGVDFCYPGARTPALAGLNLELRRGEACAIVGLNGAGKTTLVKLLAGLYQPQAGTITWKGRGMDAEGSDVWRSRIAVIFQDFQTYAMTAHDNVAFGSLSLAGNEGALDRAAERAGAGRIIQSLPSGWDTILSREYAGGVDLSRGQWQRVALARALLAIEGGAEILVLDEPTANLDVRAETEFFQRFLELTRGVTAIIISHRFATVRQAPRIVVLEGGKVAEDGGHDELMRRNGSYAALYRLQASLFVQSAVLVDALRE